MNDTTEVIKTYEFGSPVARFDIEPPSPYLREAVLFDASRSSDILGKIVSYEWEFGDGGSASGVMATHSYARVDEYTVTLTVTDDDGLTTELSRTIVITTDPDAVGGDTPAGGGGPFTLTVNIQGSGEVQSDVLDDGGVPSIFCFTSVDPEATCTADFPAETSVILTSSAFGAGTSAIWIGCDVVFLDICTVTMNIDRTVTADFR